MADCSRICGRVATGEVDLFKLCKAIPLHVWTGPGGSRRLRLPYFKALGT